MRRWYQRVLNVGDLPAVAGAPRLQRLRRKYGGQVRAATHNRPCLLYKVGGALRAATHNRPCLLHKVGGALRAATLSALLLTSGNVSAETPSPLLNLSEFADLPVLSSGRKMPMDSFARQFLVQLSGKSTVDQKPAVEWVARLCFDPESTMDDRVFLINHPEVAEALDIPVQKRRRYSFNELQGSFHELARLATQALALEPDERSLVEKDFVRAYQNVRLYMGLFNSFSFAVPDARFAPAPETASALGLEPGQEAYSFWEVFNAVPAIQRIIEPLQEKDQAEWDEVEQGAFALSAALFQQAQARRDTPLSIVPLDGHGEERWVSAWEVTSFSLQDRALRDEVDALTRANAAYSAADQEAFDEALRAFKASVHDRMGDDREMSVIPLELAFNRLKLFYRAEILYGLGFLFAFAALLTTRRWVGAVAFALTALALLPHTAGIVMRMVIMARPPVTNLYATFIFVAWVIVVMFLVVERFQRQGFGTLVASLGGLALMLLAGRFAVEGDSMGKVVAVLNSNFWLSTHVICITIGYAGCVAAGLLGHVYLLQVAARPGDREKRAALNRALYGVLGFGLTFAFFGTMLGGIWADQSWGRFWGWDPKENGALLIVIWTAILFHARMGGMIGDIGMAAGSALGIIVVAFAWIGVNLLGVGLHSYGFTSGLARGLLIYVVAQVAFVAVAAPLAARRLRQERGRAG